MSPLGAIIILVFVCARVVYVEKLLRLSLFALLDYVLIHCFGPMCINYTYSSRWFKKCSIAPLYRPTFLYLFPARWPCVSVDPADINKHVH